MNFELNFEQLKGKLKKVLNPSKFRFIVILYPNTNIIGEIKDHISSIYPNSLVTDLNLQNKSYQDISSQLYKNNEGFVYINNFEEILDNPDLYNGFNQRRDKIASHNINLICFISLYKKDELFTKALNVIPDLWEFKDTVLELEKDEKTDKLIDISVSEHSSYSSIGGSNTQDKKTELNKLLKELRESENDELKLNLLWQIAIIYRDIGESKNSLVYFLKELKIKEKLKVSEDEFAKSYSNISVMYLDIGEFEKALEYQLQALKIEEEVLDEKNPELATMYSNMSTIYGDMKEYSIALKYQEKSLKIREKILESKHPDLANSYNNISILYFNLGELQKALDYQSKSLAIREKILVDMHPALATSYNNISEIYRAMGELEKSLQYQLKSLRIRENILGNTHPMLANSYNNISILYKDMKECQKAKEFSHKAINILRELEYEHPYLITCIENLKLIESQIKKQKNAGYKKKGKYCKDI